MKKTVSALKWSKNEFSFPEKILNLILDII